MSDAPYTLEPYFLQLEAQLLRLLGYEDIATPPELDTPHPMMAQLAAAFELSDIEQQILLLCAAVELEPRFGDLCAAFHNTPTKTHVTWQLIRALFGNVIALAAPDSTLRYWHFITHNRANLPIFDTELRIDEHILHYLRGDVTLDARLQLSLRPIDDDLASPSPTQMEAVQHIIAQLARDEGWSRLPFIYLLGKPDVALIFAHYLAQRLEKQPVQLVTTALPSTIGETDLFIRLWERESRLHPLMLYIEAPDSHQQREGVEALTRRLLADTSQIIILNTQERWHLPERAGVLQTVERPTIPEQRHAWSVLLNMPEDAVAPLAEQFDLSPMMMRDIAATANSLAQGAPQEQHLHTTWQVSIANLEPQVGALAQRLPIKASWDDLVLPQETMDLLYQVVAQARSRATVYEAWGFRQRLSRGLGISVLFAGQSGTGKTMAAEVLANTLSLALYRVDLSQVVSKYIGETEENLRKLFDAAEQGGCVLFFDEADAIFGKRTDVKDSHDRYANIEVNYLLQRIESYQGLAILATNMKDALDTAFQRRLRFIIDFPFPDTSLRRRIWQGIFPKRVPLGDLDYRYLQDLPFSGGSIQNVALNAAFLAADEEQAVQMHHIRAAAYAEAQKLDLPLMRLQRNGHHAT